MVGESAGIWDKGKGYSEYLMFGELGEGEYVFIEEEG